MCEANVARCPASAPAYTVAQSLHSPQHAYLPGHIFLQTTPTHAIAPALRLPAPLGLLHASRPPPASRAQTAPPSPPPRTAVQMPALMAACESYLASTAFEDPEADPAWITAVYDLACDLSRCDSQAGGMAPAPPLQRVSLSAQAVPGRMGFAKDLVSVRGLAEAAGLMLFLSRLPTLPAGAPAGWSLRPPWRATLRARRSGTRRVAAWCSPTSCAAPPTPATAPPRWPSCGRCGRLEAGWMRRG